MAMNEEAIIVSESRATAADGDTIVVREAFGEAPEAGVPPAPSPWPPAPERQPARLPPVDRPSAPEDIEGEARTPAAADRPSGWLDSQDAKDFEPFLVAELRRIKPPGACASSHNEAERALGQYKRLNGHVSKALQGDYHGVLDVRKIDQLRELLERNIEALERMLEAHREMGKQRKQIRRRRRASDDISCPKCAAPLWEEGGNRICLACGDDGMVKEAGTPHFEGLQYQISALERALVGMLINATVAGGRDLEELFAKLEKKYKLTDRETLAIRQILSDMGYPVFKDRARIGEDEDPSNPDEPREWQAQYYA